MLEVKEFIKWSEYFIILYIDHIVAVSLKKSQECESSSQSIYFFKKIHQNYLHEIFDQMSNFHAHNDFK